MLISNILIIVNFSNLMIVISSSLVTINLIELNILFFSNLITRILKKLNIVMFNNSTITNLSYSISPKFRNLIIIIYKYFIPEFCS